MPKQNRLKKWKEVTCGMKNPGAVLIIVYISVVFFLLLFAGLESVRADFGETEEKVLTMQNFHMKENLLIPAVKEGTFTAEQIFPQNVKIFMGDMTEKKTPPSELVMVLGFFLLLLALLLAKDGKKR